MLCVSATFHLALSICDSECSNCHRLVCMRSNLAFTKGDKGKCVCVWGGSEESIANA